MEKKKCGNEDGNEKSKRRTIYGRNEILRVKKNKEKRDRRRKKEIIKKNNKSKKKRKTYRKERN